MSSALEFFTFFDRRPQLLGFYLPKTRFPSSLAGLGAYCARIFPLAVTVLASSRSNVSAPIDNRWRQSETFDTVENRCKQPLRHSYFGKLERHVFCMPGNLGPDLNELLP